MRKSINLNKIVYSFFSSHIFCFNRALCTLCMLVRKSHRISYVVSTEYTQCVLHTQPWQTLKWCRTDSNNDEPNQFLNLIMVFNFECHNYIYCTPVKIIFISALTFIECERRPFFLFTFPLAHFLLDNDLFS